MGSCLQPCFVAEFRLKEMWSSPDRYDSLDAVELVYWMPTKSAVQVQVQVQVQEAEAEAEAGAEVEVARRRRLEPDAYSDPCMLARQPHGVRHNDGRYSCSLEGCDYGY